MKLYIALTVTIFAALACAIVLAAQTTVQTVPQTGTFTVKPTDPLTESTGQSIASASQAQPYGAAAWKAFRVVATVDGNSSLPYLATRRRVACINNTANVIYISDQSGANAASYPVLPNASVSLSTTAPIYIYSANGTDAMWFIDTH